MRPARTVALALALSMGGSRLAVAEDAAATEVRNALVGAAEARDSKALAKALDAANALVGPNATFMDASGLADWLGELPKSVTRLADVQSRRGWLYVLAKHGQDAIAPLETVLSVDEKNAPVRALLGEARRQAGDFEGAVADLLRALADGAPDSAVLPSAYPLVYEVHEKDKNKAPEADALPRYAVLGSRFLAVRWIPEVGEALHLWLGYDAEVAKRDPKRGPPLKAEAVKIAWLRCVNARETDDHAALAREAYRAAAWRQGVPAANSEGVPDRIDLLAAAVRLGDLRTSDRHAVPESLAALAEEALAHGRYVLAAHMARRRLAISDSPAARRVLLACPPDVGE